MTTSTLDDITIRTTPDAAPYLALSEAINGRRVLYVCERLPVARTIVQRMRDNLAPDTVTRFRLTYPGPRIELRTGGVVYFATIRGGAGRGFNADTLVFDLEDISERVWVDAMPIINGADDPRIIIAHRTDDATRTD